MKTYSTASSDVLETHIARMQAEYHPDLKNVTVGALFVFDTESSEPVLKHQGYPAMAVVRITSLRERALRVPDALIVVDRAHWLRQSARQRDALIDHELEHLTHVVDLETGAKKYDALDRPKLRMRPHDHQLGWFDAIAKRHGEASPEVRQAKQLVESTQQLYFDFGPQQLPLTQPSVGEGFAAAAAARSSAPSPDSAPVKQPADDKSAMPVTSGEGESSPSANDVSAPPSAAVAKLSEQKFADDIGPKTRAELEKARTRRGPRPIDGRSSH